MVFLHVKSQSNGGESINNKHEDGVQQQEQ